MGSYKLNVDGTATFENMDDAFLARVKEEARLAVGELLAAAALKQGDILVVGCSTSEVMGCTIGKASVPETAAALLAGILPLLRENGIYIAAQCCEHLNRALIMESACAERYGLDPVSVRPQPKAGGSFATAAYAAFDAPIALEEIRADAGLDIGGTLIGMHLKKVAVPVRLSVKTIGAAPLLAARTRPKFIGGIRAQYNEDLL